MGRLVVLYPTIIPREIEMLPLVTCHDVKVVGVVDVLVILRIGIEKQVALQIAVVGIADVVSVP